MHESRNYGVRSKAQLLGNNPCNGNRVHNVWLARLAALRHVCLARKGVGITNALYILGRETAGKTPEQIIDLFINLLNFQIHTATCFYIISEISHASSCAW